MKKFYAIIFTTCLLMSSWANAGIVSGKKFVSAITAPAITSFSPATGTVGTLVTITGTSLSSPTAFTIGGAAAIVVSNTGTTLVGMVMPGAATGGVSVTTSGGTASGGSNFTVTQSGIPDHQQTANITPSGSSGGFSPGFTVGISADGNTAAVGNLTDNANKGATWVFIRNNGIWTQQSTKLVGTGAVGAAQQGMSVALSADGNTLITGGSSDNHNVGAAWVFTRNSSGVWAQQGSKLVGTGMGTGGTPFQGRSVALSADGNTALIGSPGDVASSVARGAVYVFKRSGSTWAQQGNKLVGVTDAASAQGSSVALSADGNTAVIGAPSEFNSSTIRPGAAWVFVQSGGVWSQQGDKLVVTGNTGSASVGTSVSVSADGNTALISGPDDNSGFGATWVFTRSSGVWSQQGSKLVGTGSIGTHSQQSRSVTLSADGNTAIICSKFDNTDQNGDGRGALWVFKRAAGTWTQQGAKITAQETGLDISVAALSADGSTIAVGVAGTLSGNGGFLAFNTSLPYPVATTSSATSVDVATATLNGHVKDNGFATTVSFIYGTSPTLSGTTTTVAATTGGTISPGAGTTAVAVNLTQLLSGHQYYFKVAATTSDTTTYGDILSFTTLPSHNAVLSHLSVSAGTLSPVFAQQTTNYSVTVPNNTTNFTVTPTTSNAFATVKVNGTTVPSGAHSAVIPLVEGSNLVTTKVTAQDGSTTKSYTISVTKTVGKPIVTTVSASTITPGTATLTGTAADNGRNTTVRFVYGTSPTLAGATFVPGILVSAGSGPTSLSADIDGLISATTYYYQITASNAFGESKGTILSFTTLPSINALLFGLSVSTGTLSPAFDSETTNYLVSVPGSTSSVTVTPTASHNAATVKVNGVTVLSGHASASIPLSSGNNIINTVVTAQDGSTTKMYTINVRTTPVTDPVVTTLSATAVDVVTATLNGQVQDNGLPATVSFVYGTSPTLSGTTTTVDATTGGTISAGSGTTAASVDVKALLSNVQYYFRVVANSSGIITNGDIHSFTTLPSRNAILSNLAVTPGTFTHAFTQQGISYTVNYPNSTTSIKVRPTTLNAFATVKVNGVTVVSGNLSASIPLSVGNNTITTIVTAQDGTTTKTYTITANRASGGLNAAYYSVLQKEENPLPATDDNVIVHQALSPNGDGINDRLAVDGIGSYPDNTLTILNRNGVVVFETKGYDNGTKAFDGHSNKTGAMQQAGTYFYTLDYKADGEIKHKTGYIILKY